MRIPDWKLERLALGELSPAETERLQAQVNAEPELQARLAALQENNAEVLKEHPPEKVAQEVSRRRASEERRQAATKPSTAPGWGFFFGLRTALPVAAAAVVAVVVLTRGGPDTPVEKPEVILLKGDPSIFVYRKAGTPERLDSGARAKQGDVLQVSYDAKGAKYGAIVSLDGRGAVTVHFPDEGRATALDAGGEVSVAHAYELDDAPSFERFFFVTSDAPVDVAAVVAAARALAQKGEAARSETLPLPASLSQRSLLLVK